MGAWDLRTSKEDPSYRNRQNYRTTSALMLLRKTYKQIIVSAHKDIRLCI